LRKFYDFGVTRGWTSTNPAQEVALLSETVSLRSRSLTAVDIARLLAAVKKDGGRWAARDWAVIQILVGTGLKIGELTQLQIADIHLEGDQPHLDVRDTSGDYDRTLPLDADLRDALQHYLSNRRAVPDTDYLFLNRDGNPLSTRSVQRMLHRHAEEAGLEGLTSQSLRYMYARKAYERCNDIEVVARLLGHQHLATTIRYLRPGSKK
jgi:integrase/recombinase XerC